MIEIVNAQGDHVAYLPEPGGLPPAVPPWVGLEPHARHVLDRPTPLADPYHLDNDWDPWWHHDPELRKYAHYDPRPVNEDEARFRGLKPLTVGELRDRYADGRITLEELEELLPAALEAEPDPPPAVRPLRQRDRLVLGAVGAAVLVVAAAVVVAFGLSAVLAVATVAAVALVIART